MTLSAPFYTMVDTSELLKEGFYNDLVKLVNLVMENVAEKSGKDMFDLGVFFIIRK